MDEPIRPRTASDPTPCPWCTSPVVTGKCSACGRTEDHGQTDALSERPVEEPA